MATMMEDLATLGKEIEAAKRNLASLEGRRIEVMSRLKTDTGLSSLTEAEADLIKVNSALAAIDVTITNSHKKLKDNFSW